MHVLRIGIYHSRKSKNDLRHPVDQFIAGIHMITLFGGNMIYRFVLIYQIPMASLNTTILSNVYRLVAKNQTKKAIEKLLAHVENNFDDVAMYHGVIVISNKYHHLCQAINDGVLDFETAEIARTKLLFQLLNLVEEFKEETGAC